MQSRPWSIDAGPVWVYLLSFAALFVRFGYNYAAGDQDELIPLLLSMLDPSLFQSDWFVQMQSAELGVRTYVVWLLLPFSRVLPIPSVVFGMYLLCWMLIGSGAFRVARKLVDTRVAAAAAVFLSLGVFHKWTLGGNDVVYTMFVGEMLAWGLALHGLHYWLKQRDMKAAVLLGVAAWFQLLVGLLLAGVLLIERVWDRASAGSAAWHRKNDFLALGVFLLAAMPAILPVAIQQFDALAVDGDLVFYILAPFRNPFHHMLSSFGQKAIARFVVMLAAGVAAALYLHRRSRLNDGTKLLRFTTIAIVLCAITAIFTEIWPLLIVAKFQAYKLTVVVKLLLLIVIARVLVAAIPKRVVVVANGLLKRGPAAVIASSASLIIVLVLAAAKPSFLLPRLTHDLHVASDLGKMEGWIRDNTDQNAVFAIPPDNSTFRSNARRAIVVNYPAFPFDDVDMLTWYERLLDVAPIEPPSSGLGLKPVLNDAFHAQSVAEWWGLKETYDIDFLLVDESKMTHLHPLERVHAEDSWTLYKLAGQ